MGNSERITERGREKQSSTVTAAKGICALPGRGKFFATYEVELLLTESTFFALCTVFDRALCWSSKGQLV